MSRCRMSSYLARPGSVQRACYHVDASGKVLGRLAGNIARVLMGKHKPQYTPHIDTGDMVVVTNAAKIRVTGKKAWTMTYANYTYHPGGYRETPFLQVLERHPDRILREAVRRMLPKNALGRKMLAKLKISSTETHLHTAQSPQPWPF